MADDLDSAVACFASSCYTRTADLVSGFDWDNGVFAVAAVGLLAVNVGSADFDSYS